MSKCLHSFLVLFLLIFPSCSVFATTYTWNHLNGGSFFWQDGSFAPAGTPNVDDIANFPTLNTGTGTMMVVCAISPITVGQLNFVNNASGATYRLTTTASTVMTFEVSSGTALFSISGTAPTDIGVFDGSYALNSDTVFQLRSGTGISNSVSGAGKLIISQASSSDAISFSGVNALTGGLSITAGNATFSTTSIPTGTIEMSGVSRLNLITGGTYTQDFVVTNTPRISAGGSTLNGSITGAGSLTFVHTSGTATYGQTGGIASPSGGVIISTSGVSTKVQMGAANAFNCDVTVSSGGNWNLNGFAQSIGNFSGAGTTTLGNGTLTTTITGSQSYTGVIASGSGTGGLTKQGSGTLILTGTNTYTGLTTVAAGTLQGKTASLPGDIDNYSTLIWNQTSAGTYSHNISQSLGLGTMQVQGGGLLTTTGSLTQNTITVLSGGQMALDGTATVSTLTVNSGGSLIGQGSVTGNVDVFGTLGAGHSIGTLTVTGNYTQESGSTFVVEIVPSPPQVDLLEVSNTITLGDHVATFSLMPTMGDYPVNEQYVVMHGAGGVSGRFIEPITNSLPSFNATLHYTPLPTVSAEGPSLLGDPAVTYVVLLVNTVTPSNLPVSPTAVIAARCFDTIPNNPFAEYLLFMQIPQMNMTLEQMLPSAFGSLDLTQHDLITQVREAATREMNLFLKNPCEAPKRFRIWTDAFFPRVVQHCRHNQMGYYSSALGAALGFDYQVSPNSFFGVFATYTKNHLRGKGTDIDGWMHNVYGSCYAGGWISSLQRIYAQAVVSGAYDHYHTMRSIYFAGEQFDPFTEEPRARFHGSSGLGSFEIGKYWSRVARNQLYGRIDYSFNYRNHFQEYNASTLNLKVKGHFSDFIRLELGDAISRCVTLQHMLCDARLAAGGVLEYQINGKTQKASFTTSSCVMSADGPTLGRAFLFWELGAQIHINKNYLNVIAGNFRGEYGSGFVSHNWSVELKTSF